MKLGRNDLQDKPDGWICPFFFICCQGAELFGAKDGKMGVLAVFEGF